MVKVLVVLLVLLCSFGGFASSEFGGFSGHGETTYSFSSADTSSSFNFDTTFRPQLQMQSGIVLNNGSKFGPTLMTDPSTNIFARSRFLKDQEITTSYNGAALSQNVLDPIQFRASARAFCNHMAAGKAMSERPEGCRAEGSSSASMCDLSGVMSTDVLAKLQQTVAANPSRKVDACLDELNRAKGTILVTDAATSTDASSASYVVDEIKDEDAAAVVAEGCNQTTSIDGETAKACDDFDKSALGSSDTSSLISSFITDYQGFGDWSISRMFSFTSKVACERCFERKYGVQQGLIGGSRDDFKTRYQQQLKSRLVELRARKAEEALSEYLKFQERNLFMSEYLSAQPERCNSAQSLRRLPKLCKTDKANEVLKELAKRHNVAFDGRDVGAFVDGLQQALWNQMIKPMPTFACQGREITHHYYLQSSQPHVANGPMAPDSLFTAEAKRDIAACGEHDQRCFLRALVKVRASQLRGDAEEAEREIRNFFRQPFYRTLISNRNNLLDYATTERISRTNPFNAYLEKHRDLLATAASRDAANACRSFDKDFTDALCVSDGDLADHYSGAGLRQELNDLLGAPSDASGPDKVVTMAVACNIMSSAGDMKTEVHQSKASFDNVFDRRELADVFLRGNVRRAPIDSPKTQAFIAKFSLELCDKASFHQIQEYADNISNQSSDSEGFDSFDPSTFSMDMKASVSGPRTLVRSVGSVETGGLVGINLFNGVNYGVGSASALKPSSTLDSVSFDGAFDNDSRYGLGTSSRASVSFRDESYPGQSSVEFNFNPYGLNFVDGPRIPSSTELAGLDVTRAPASVTSEVVFDKKIESTAQAVATEVGTHVPLERLEDTVERAVEDRFIPGAVQANGIMAPVPVLPVMGGEIASPYDVQSGVVSSAGGEANGSTYRRWSASERFVQQVEVQQVQDEQALLAQAKEQQVLQDLKNQAQIEQLRLELQKIQISNQQLLASVKRLSQPAQENVFDPPVVAEQVSEEIEVTEDSDRPAAPRSSFRAPASVAAKSESSAQSSRGPSEQTSSAPRVQSAGPANIPRPRAVDDGAASVSSSTTAASASVAVSRGGSQAASGRSSGPALTASVFKPSSGLQRTITTGQSVEALPQEKRVELLQEFLSYVERNPDYREGRYLNPENSQVEIDYEGRTVVLKVQDIQDPQVRTQLQERLLRQRVVLNQYARATRLQSLRRLLASTRMQAP